MFISKDDIKDNEMLEEYLILLPDKYKDQNIYKDTFSEDLINRYYKWLDRRKDYLLTIKNKD